MRPPKADAVFGLVCEDIRSEASGRLSLMGVFGPTIQAPTLPITLPGGLCAILFVRNPGEPLTKVTISVRDPAGKDILPAMTNDIAGPYANIQHQFQLQIVPFPLAAEGDITFRYTFNDGEEIGIEFAITVQKKPAPGS
jgi:hypothetical protein